MIKLVFFFNQYRQGFSETYYVPGDDPADVARNLSTQILQAIVNFRTSITQLWAVRATKVDGSSKKSYLRLLRGSYAGGIAPTAGAEPDVVSTTAVYKIAGQTGKTRRVFFRGLPDSFVLRDNFGNDLLPAGLRDAVQLFLALAKASQWSVRYVNDFASAAPLNAAVKQLTQNSDNPWQTNLSFTGGSPHSSYLNVPLKFSGMPSDELPKFPKQTFSTKEVPGTPTLIAINYALPGGIAVFPKNAKMWVVTYGYDVFTTWEFERFSEHKSGRPFGALRGASRAVSL